MNKLCVSFPKALETSRSRKMHISEGQAKAICGRLCQKKFYSFGADLFTNLIIVILPRSLKPRRNKVHQQKYDFDSASCGSNSVRPKNGHNFQ